MTFTTIGSWIRIIYFLALLPHINAMEGMEDELNALILEVNVANMSADLNMSVIRGSI